ncbi:DUF2288 domain-containing protein [Spongiibacter sp. KMU-158]|uniref:DUF2288 domain-containing protein n=1 Tax=Spongiibacter pelagi TaxID=2760804 RepID=A0A927C0S9_9GAMM|nr:DUF2288 domain-containing protein [Spongiibacter pelagi]MBD2859154.1 DUF2288 domain-containing protein [Spongiibacter pelagi]
MNDPHDDLLTKLNRETAKIAWSELDRFYATGAVVEVAASEDLVNVAKAMAEDDAAQISRLMGEGLLFKVDDQRAAQFQEGDRVLWAVVVAPWVLVQDR